MTLDDAHMEYTFEEGCNDVFYAYHDNKRYEVSFTWANGSTYYLEGKEVPYSDEFDTFDWYAL